MEQIYFNGRILTMDEKTAEDAISKAPEAVLIKDGVIKALGTLHEVEQKADTDVYKTDLQGKCLMPSFIDSHGHFVMNGQMSMCADLSACKSYDDIIQTLKQYIEKNKITKEGVVIGFGYDHNFLAEEGQPDKRVLDQVSKEIPILAMHVSGHLACVNSAALELAEIDERTPSPSGGVIGRIGTGNEPSGYLEEAGMLAVQQAVAPRIKIDFAGIVQGMQKTYIENGVTTVQDGATSEGDIKTLLAMSAGGQLKIDVVAYPLMPSGAKKIVEENQGICGTYCHRLKIGGYKLVLDGSPQGRSAWMTEPYLGGEEGYCGYPWMSDAEVQSYVKQAVEERRQLLVHCNGDAAGDQFLNAYERAIKETEIEEDLRPVMIHCQTIRNDQLDRMVKLKMIASVFVGHVWYWGDIHMKNFGPARGNHISPVKDAMDRGLMVNFHQDTPVTKPNMLHSVWCAVNRISRKGTVIGEDQKISVYDALKAVTINAAYEYFEEDSKGTISVGKRADLVVLDQSPLEVDPVEIKNIKVMETIKDGISIYQRG